MLEPVDLNYTEQKLPGHLRLSRYRISTRDASQITLTNQVQAELNQSRNMYRYKLFIDPAGVDEPDTKKHFEKYQIMGLDLWSADADQRILEAKLAELKNPVSKVIPILFQCGLSSEPDQLDNPNLPFVEALQARMAAEAADPSSPLHGHEIMLIGFSQPGFGQSVFTKDLQVGVADVNDQAAANLYEGIIKALGIPMDKAKVILAGHSAGGSALFDLLKANPDWEARAVLFNPALSPDKSQLRLFKDLYKLEKYSSTLLEIINRTTKDKIDLSDFKNAISEVIMRALLGDYNHEQPMKNLVGFVRDALYLIKSEQVGTRKTGTDELTIPASFEQQSKMHAKQSIYSRGLLGKLEALATIVTPVDRATVTNLGKVPAFFIGSNDRITPYAERWVRQYYEELFAAVGERAGLTEEDKATILGKNTGQPGDDHFSGSHDGMFIHNGTQIRAAEMIIEQAKRMVSPDPADPVIRIEQALQKTA